MPLRIGGEDRAGGAGAVGADRPRAGEPAFRVALADARDLDDALAAADASAWRASPGRARRDPEGRGLLAERAGRDRHGLTIETGKPLAEARAEWGGTADQFEWYAEETKRIYGQLIEARDPDVRLAVIYQPIGVVAAFTAWNFPSVLLARKLGAALAAGCPVVLKASEETPWTAAAIVATLEDAGLPPARSTSCSATRRRSPAPARKPIVKALTFTGSTAVGPSSPSSPASPAVLELGGHAPAIVCADADVDAAIDALTPPSTARPGSRASRRAASTSTTRATTSSRPSSPSARARRSAP